MDNIGLAIFVLFLLLFPKLCLGLLAAIAAFIFGTTF
jgi:hypothetical protein